MGRRSLPKISDNLDLTHYFKGWDDLPQPFSCVALFGNNEAPLELEIGSGKGLFIRKAATDNPAHCFLGVEIAYRYAIHSAAGLCKRGIKNAVMLNADAARLLQEWIPDESLEAVHVYFPDPWWKKAHRKRRVLRTEVLQLIERKLQPGKMLHFWTDVEEYYLSTLKIIESDTNLQGPFDVDQAPATDDMDYHTHFERRTRLNELPVYRCFFLKHS